MSELIDLVISQSAAKLGVEIVDDVVSPPVESKDDNKLIPKPEMVKPIPKPRTVKPIPKPRTIIKQAKKALKGLTASFEVWLRNDEDPLRQLVDSRRGIEFFLKKQLLEMSGLKLTESLEVTLVNWANEESCLL